MQETDLYLEKSRQSLPLLPGSPPGCSRSENRMRNDTCGSCASISPEEKGRWHLPTLAPQTPTHSSSKKKKREKLGPRQPKASDQTCAWRAANGAEQKNLVTQLFITLAFKSQETEDPALYELEIRFSHQANEGAELDRGHRLQYPQHPPRHVN